MRLTKNLRERALPQRIHIVGIGGAGLSGSARLLAQSGYDVTGFDRAMSIFLEGLGGGGVNFHVGEEGRPPLGADVGLVVRSAAVPEDDPDCLAARKRNIPVWKYARLLRELSPRRRTLAVAGTHGKTSVAWNWRAPSFGRRNFCCSTNRPTTSTWPRSSGWRATSQRSMWRWW